jgi:hypothetical protein
MVVFVHNQYAMDHFEGAMMATERTCDVLKCVGDLLTPDGLFCIKVSYSNYFCVNVYLSFNLSANINPLYLKPCFVYK